MAMPKSVTIVASTGSAVQETIELAEPSLADVTTALEDLTYRLCAPHPIVGVVAVFETSSGQDQVSIGGIALPPAETAARLWRDMKARTSAL